MLQSQSAPNDRQPVGEALRGGSSSVIDASSQAHRRLARSLRQARVAVLLIAGVSCAGAHALGIYSDDETTNNIAQSSPPSSQIDKPAEQVYKNIQVFKGLPASQLDGAMSFMAASLGVACNHCHVAAWESDENGAKQSARRMIEMMRGINKQNYGATPVITCYTCHRGSPDPASAPDANDTAWQQATDTDTNGSRPAPLPSIDAIVDKYYQALGGRAAVYNLKTAVLTGEQTTTNRTDQPVTVRFEAIHSIPDRLRLSVITPGWPQSYILNGSSGWIVERGTRRVMNDEEIARIKREPDFTEFLRLTERFPSIRVFGMEKLGNRDVYSVGASAADGTRQKLYFDIATGFLVRRIITIKTVLGSLPEITDFEDYRAVDGIKLPFKITWSRAPFSISRSFSKIKLNVPIEDSKSRLSRDPR